MSDQCSRYPSKSLLGQQHMLMLALLINSDLSDLEIAFTLLPKNLHETSDRQRTFL